MRHSEKCARLNPLNCCQEIPFVIGNQPLLVYCPSVLSVAHVAIHPSAFPENVRRDLLRSLHTRRINPKFLYVTHRQSQLWLALHEAHSPARTDPGCIAIYDRSFETAADVLRASRVHVIGLGCGGGQKDARLLRSLAGWGGEVSYCPCDVSLSLVLTSAQAAQKEICGITCHPLVCDIGAAEDLAEVFSQQTGASVPRVLAFFGMIPNFEPELILPWLAALVRPNDLLLFSANLAPGSDYAAGVQKILPGYDNPQTRDWLAAFLYDLGVERDDGVIRFSIEESASACKRIVADYHFSRERVFKVYDESFVFAKDDKIRLFFSYRHTPRLVESLLLGHRLSILGQWIAPTGEEGVFLCQRAGDRPPKKP